MAPDETSNQLDEEHARLLKEGDEEGWNEPSAAMTAFVILSFAGPILAIPFGIGLVASWLSDFGASIEPQLYETVAEVTPVILLATLGTQYFVMGPALRELERERSDPSGYRALLAEHLSREIGLFIVVETCALIGVALGYSTTFLTVTMLSALAGMLISFFRAQHDYFFGALRRSQRSEE